MSHFETHGEDMDPDYIPPKKATPTRRGGRVEKDPYSAWDSVPTCVFKNIPFVSFEELRSLFHLSISDASDILGVCSTVLKKIARNYAIPRWPHRKVAAIDKMIGDVKKEMARLPPGKELESAKLELASLQQKRDYLLDNPDKIQTANVRKNYSLATQRRGRKSVPEADVVASPPDPETDDTSDTTDIMDRAEEIITANERVGRGPQVTKRCLKRGRPSGSERDKSPEDKKCDEYDTIAPPAVEPSLSFSQLMGLVSNLSPSAQQEVIEWLREQCNIDPQPGLVPGSIISHSSSMPGYPVQYDLFPSDIGEAIKPKPSSPPEDFKFSPPLFESPPSISLNTRSFHPTTPGPFPLNTEP